MAKKLPQVYASLQNPAQKLLGIIFGIMGGLGVGITLLIFMKNVGDFAAILDFSQPEKSIPYFIPILTFGTFLIVGLILFAFARRKQASIASLIQNGKRIKVTVASNVQNFHYRVNGVPQRKVVFKNIHGETFNFNFFNERFAQLLPVGATLHILADEKGRCLPDPEYFQTSDEEGPMDASAKSREASEQFTIAGDKYFQNREYESALEFYLSGYRFHPEPELGKKIYFLAKQLAKPELIEDFERFA